MSCWCQNGAQKRWSSQEGWEPPLSVPLPQEAAAISKVLDELQAAWYGTPGCFPPVLHVLCSFWNALGRPFRMVLPFRGMLFFGARTGAPVVLARFPTGTRRKRRRKRAGGSLGVFLGSSRTPPPPPMPRACDAHAGRAEFAQGGHERLALFGHSIGAWITLRHLRAMAPERRRAVPLKARATGRRRRGAGGRWQLGRRSSLLFWSRCPVCLFFWVGF